MIKHGKSVIGYLFVMVVFSSVWARDYYVSVSGVDSNDGLSLSAPFKTIQKAASLAVAGDVVNIRAGIYREEVSIYRSGSAGQPITFQSYNGEDVMVTTTDTLNGWTQHDGNIYKTSFSSFSLSRNEMTIFVDGQWIHEANWTDKSATADQLSRSTYATYNGGTRTSIYDDDLKSFPDDYWNGAFIWVQSSNWSLETHRITDFTSSTGTITFDGSLGYDPKSGFEYLIFDSYKALDAAGEWYFDDTANVLYMWAPGGGDPDSYLVEAKQRQECFDLNGKDYISIIGIDMRGGDLDMDGCDNILLQGSHIQMPDRRFGAESGGSARALLLNGNNNIIRDNEFESIWSQAISLSGSYNQIVNNYFHDIGYSNGNGAAVGLSNSKVGNLISHNTFERVGRAAIGGVGYRFVLQYNDFSNVAILTEDVGAIYFLNNSYSNSIIHHNVFHDINAYLSTGMYLDNMGTDLVYHHNISYNISAFGLKVNLPTAFFIAYNNTCYNSGNIDAWSATDTKDARGSRFINNIYKSLDSDMSAGGATIANNHVSSDSGNFVSASTGDFRLKSTSGAVDKGIEIPGITDGFIGDSPDAGALELNQSMWAYGHDFANPPYPVYDWQAIAYTNRIENPGFDSTLSPWTSLVGTPARVGGNAWNYKDDALAIAGSGALELNPGEKIQQVVEGLKPDTIYEFSASGRMVYDIQIEDYDLKSGSFTSGSYRDENWLGDLNAGEWLCYDDVDFGDTLPLYNRIEIGQQWDTFIDVELRLDSPTGQLLAQMYLPGGDNRWYMAREDISAVTGMHDLYLIFLGDAASNAMIDRIRLLDTATNERLKLIVNDYDGDSEQLSEVFGGAYWGDNSRHLFFKTGPDTTSVTVALRKVPGNSNGYIDQVVLVEADITSLEQTPYAPHLLPCRIEAEEYDIGQNQISYSDTTAGNSGGKFRTDDVDIESRDGGYTVGWTSAGEWLEYTSDITAGIYNLTARVSAVSDGKSFSVRINGVFVAEVDVPNTGDWGVFETVTVPGILLSEGTDEVISIEMTTGSMNINWIEFEFVGDSSVPDAPSNLETTQITFGQVDLSWLDNSNNESSFLVRRKFGASGLWEDIASLPSDSTTFTDVGLERSQYYYYAVYAVNGVGGSDSSNVAYVNTIFDLPEFTWFAGCWNDINPRDGVILYDGFDYTPSESLNTQDGWSDFINLGGDDVIISQDKATENTSTDSVYKMYLKSLSQSMPTMGDTYYFAIKITPTQEATADEQLVLFGWANANSAGRKFEVRYSSNGAGTITITGNNYYKTIKGHDVVVGRSYLLVAKTSPVAGYDDRVSVDVGLFDITNGTITAEGDYDYQVMGYIYQYDSLDSQFASLLLGHRSDKFTVDDLIFSTSWTPIRQVVASAGLPESWDCENVDFDGNNVIDISELKSFADSWLELPSSK